MKVVNERKAIALKKITDASKELEWMSKNFERPYPGIRIAEVRLKALCEMARIMGIDSRDIYEADRAGFDDGSID